MFIYNSFAFHQISRRPKRSSSLGKLRFEIRDTRLISYSNSKAATLMKINNTLYVTFQTPRGHITSATVCYHAMHAIALVRGVS